jgi:hypothetical protein
MRKHLRYFWYVLRHKWFVFLACCRYGIIWRGITHDLSKFLPSEWTPYVDNFFGKKPPSKETTRAFDMAWLHHQHRNAHHWQYYLLRHEDGTVEALEMSPADTFEMVADWVGAGRAITGKVDVWSWYKKNTKNMHLHPTTRKAVETMLKSLGREYGVVFTVGDAEIGEAERAQAIQS